MWKSPIEIAEEITKQIDMDFENGIIKAVQRVGIDVDKEELLKALQYDRGQYEKGYQDGLNANKWIPCSESLPDTPTQVLVTLGHTYESDYTMYSIARYIHFENGECHWCDNHYGYLEWDKFSDGKGGDSSRRVLAWMPLPEPYKGE